MNKVNNQNENVHRFFLNSQKNQYGKKHYFLEKKMYISRKWYLFNRKNFIEHLKNQLEIWLRLVRRKGEWFRLRGMLCSNSRNAYWQFEQIYPRETQKGNGRQDQNNGLITKLWIDKTNSFQIRKELGIVSVRWKIENNAQERIGDVLRMPNSRIVKRTVLGHWKREATQKVCFRNETLEYWCRLLSETRKGWTDLQNLTRDRKRWKALIIERTAFIEELEAQMCNVSSWDPKPKRSQFATEDRNQGFRCRWVGCDRICANKSGRTQQERKTHQNSTRHSQVSVVSEYSKRKG